MCARPTLRTMTSVKQLLRKKKDILQINLLSQNEGDIK